MSRGLNVFVNIGARVSTSVGASAAAVERRLSRIGRTVRLASAEMDATMAGATRRWGSFRSNIGSFTASVSAPMGLMAGLGGRAVYEWAKVGNELQAVTQMTDKARRDIEAVARAQLGNPAENLQAALDLARSGFDPEQIRVALPTVIRMAKSDPSVDTAAASDIATNVIQGMRVPVDQFAAAADKLAFAASRSSTDIRLLGDSFKYAGPVASRLGSNLTEMSAAFMTMANAGIKGSESGVAMRSMFVRMVKPTKGGLAALQQLGIDPAQFVSGRRASNADDVLAFMNAQGIDARSARSRIEAEIRGGATGTDLYRRITDVIVSTLGDSGDAIDRDAISSGVVDAMTSAADKVDWVGFMTALRDKGATTAQINTIFDSRQGTRLMTLMSGNDLHRNLLLMQQGAPGWLKKMFDVSNKGVVGAFGRLSQGAGNLLISMAESGVLDTIANGMNSLASSMMALSRTNPAVLKGITWTVLGLAAAGPVGMVFSGIASGINLIGSAAEIGGRFLPIFGRTLMTVLGIAPRIASIFGGLAALFEVGGIGAVVGALAPVIAVIAAIGLAIAFVVAKWNGIKAFFKGFGEGFMKALQPVMPQLNAFGSAVMSVLRPVGGMFVWLYRHTIKPVVDWLGKLFAPAETAKWHGWGAAAGDAIGTVVRVLVRFCEWIGKGISLIAKFNGARLTGPGGQPVMGRDGQPIRGPSLAGGLPGLVSYGLRRMTAPRPAARRAAGGSIIRSRAHSVNEHGLEILAEGRSGTIIPAKATDALLSALAVASGARPAAMAGGAGMTWHGDLVVNGASDPLETARAVRRELQKLMTGQAGGLHD